MINKFQSSPCSFSFLISKAIIRRTRIANGFSMIEMLVALVISGIALAGITELMWVNTSWFSFLQNKFDTFYAAKRFIKELKIDARNSLCFNANSSTTNLNLKTLNESQYTNYGFVSEYSNYEYKVIPDSEVGSEGQFLITVTNPKGTHTVLRGIVGPLGAIDNQPKIFQYLDRNSDPQDSPSDNTVSIIVNLELQRLDFGRTQRDTKRNSGLALRDEIFLRNRLIHAQ